VTTPPLENPYGLAHLWQQGDIITRSVAMLLLGMSVLSWTVIVLKSLQLKQIHQQARIAGDAFWHSKTIEMGLEKLGAKQNNPFRQLVEDGMSASAHHSHNHDELHGMLNLNEWLTNCLRRSVEDITHTLQAKLPILASIGSTAPFVGLFGTVWGIYHALVTIAFTGQASIDQLAGPVGEALIMTAFGLAVAIPAVLGYNALSSANRRILARIRNFTHDLHAYLLTGQRMREQHLTSLEHAYPSLEQAYQSMGANS